MKVAVAGAGNVGVFIANDLAEAGHEVLLLEQDPGVVSRSAPTLTGPWENGGSIEWRTVDACEVTSLREADLSSVDVVVAATGDDEDNLVISLLAKQEFAVPRVVARVNHPKNEWLFNENWGVDVSVSTPHLILALTEEALSVGSLVRLLQLEKGRARLVEVTLADDSPVIGPMIRELNIPRDSTFVAVVREEHVVVPRGDTAFQAGDEVIALVTPESEDEIRRMLTGK
jgi:trk/ktr system potassium uptake protein